MKRNRIQRGKVKIVNPNLKLREEVKKLKKDREAVISANKELIGEIRVIQESSRSAKEALHEIGKASINQTINTTFEFKWNGLFMVLFDLFITLVIMFTLPMAWADGRYFLVAFDIIILILIFIKRT